MVSEILVGITIAVISAAIVYKLGFSGGHSRVTIHSVNSSGSKGWKSWIVVGWLMVIGGIYNAGTYAPISGLDDWRTGMGISLIFFGICSICIGRFGLWWNR